MEHDFEFALGQRVLAYSQGLLYEAKCIRQRVTEVGQNQYFIHYKGFKAKWDEWTDEDEVLEINEINLGHKNRLEARRNSERTKKSQKSRIADASSSTPATRKRGNPENNVARAGIPVVENAPIHIVEDDEILVIDDEPMGVENEEVTVVNNEATVCPDIEILFHNIPPSMLLANELRSIKLPRFLKGAMDFDRTMNNAFGMILKFPEKNFVAEVLHEFTKSIFFVDDDAHKKHTILFPVTLMKYFNISVHSYLMYKNEKKYHLQSKGMKYFRQRLRDRPNINYVLKSHVIPRRIWCYLYGPIYLIRLLVNLPKIFVTNSWHPPCYETNMFVLHIKQLMRFLEHNYDTYFSVYDYMPMNHSRHTKNVFLRQAGCRR